MVYEVISPRGRGTGNIVGVHTESPQCIDSLDMQKAMVAGGSKITFEGTEEEYEAVKDKLHPKTKLYEGTDAQESSLPFSGEARHRIPRMQRYRYQSWQVISLAQQRKYECH